jgi:hypothetical protein
MQNKTHFTNILLVVVFIIILFTAGFYFDDNFYSQNKNYNNKITGFVIKEGMV